MAEIKNKSDRPDLSTADLAILRMLAGSMSDREIAFALEISVEELSEEIERICDALGVKDRDSATELAVSSGLVKIDL